MAAPSHSAWTNELYRTVLGDMAYGSALGCLAWQRDAQGKKSRRLVWWGEGAGQESLIWPEMEDAARVYRKLWLTWRVVQGFPRQGLQAVDPARLVNAPVQAGGRGGGPFDGLQESDQKAQSLARAWRVAHDGVRRLRQGVLVAQVLETVILEDVFVPLMLERPMVLEALRRGLIALEQIFRDLPLCWFRE